MLVVHNTVSGANINAY